MRKEVKLNVNMETGGMAEQVKMKITIRSMHTGGSENR